MATYAVVLDLREGGHVIFQRFLDKRRAEAAVRRLQKQQNYFATGTVKRIRVKEERS